MLKGTEALTDMTMIFQEISEKYKGEMEAQEHSFAEEIKRRNREIKSISNAIGKKKKKNEFDQLFRQMFERYYQQGLEVEALENQYQTTSGVRMGICHKDFTHHNVIVNNEKTAIVHFDNLGWGSIVLDLALYLRKVMEKNQWSIELAKEIIGSFNDRILLTEKEYQQLYLRMAYPVRFLKVVNHYANTRRNRVNLRDLDKLKALEQQEALRQQFLVFLQQFGV